MTESKEIEELAQAVKSLGRDLDKAIDRTNNSNASAIAISGDSLRPPVTRRTLGGQPKRPRAGSTAGGMAPEG